jgi:dynein heavy chain
MQTKLDGIVTSKFTETPGALDYINKNPIIFGDFRTCLKPTEPRLYEDVGDFDFMKPHFEEVLDEYNITNKKMNLVMFEDALEHLTRVHRTMRLPQVTYYLTF